MLRYNLDFDAFLGLMILDLAKFKKIFVHEFERENGEGSEGLSRVSFAERRDVMGPGVISRGTQGAEPPF